MIHQIAEKNFYTLMLRNSGFNHSKSITRSDYDTLL